MFTQLRSSVSLIAAMTILTGFVYPAIVTAVAQLASPFRANGSLIVVSGRIVGSELIGQQFSQPQYFWGRLSATGPTPYHAASSSGSNFGPMNPSLVDAAKARIQQLVIIETAETAIPVDLVTASASGLDPHISPAAAEFQVARVAQYRKMKMETVRALLAKHTALRQLGIFGEPCVNVLMLNLELDELASLQVQDAKP